MTELEAERERLGGERVLRWEMRVERAVREPGGLADFGDADAVDAALTHQARGRFDKLGAVLRRLLLADFHGRTPNLPRSGARFRQPDRVTTSIFIIAYAIIRLLIPASLNNSLAPARGRPRRGDRQFTVDSFDCDDTDDGHV